MDEEVTMGKKGHREEEEGIRPTSVDTIFLLYNSNRRDYFHFKLINI